MKITPLDIQQQQFRVRFRGFDMVEVDNFLDLLASEFEELLKENSKLQEEDRRKLARINELEASEKELRDTLVSVQRITEEMRNNARKEAETIIEEAKLNARRIIDSAQTQALHIEAEINQLKRQRAQFEASLEATIELHRKLLANSKENAGEPESGEDE
ncbi:MAG: DivIVA domain-containing protein [Deltaproteobacteria bacterium]|nr:DivIVA domain-containing protein [Deltaproteobacteria bacterium]